MKVPAVGESITEVTVATWNKKEGDHVKLDEVLCELESDKATFELPAEAEGVLHIVAKEGDVLPIGAVICTIEAGGATASVKVADAPAAAAVAANLFLKDSSSGTSNGRPKHRLTSISVAKFDSKLLLMGKFDIPTWGCWPNIRW